MRYIREEDQKKEECRACRREFVADSYRCPDCWQYTVCANYNCNYCQHCMEYKDPRNN